MGTVDLNQRNLRENYVVDGISKERVRTIVQDSNLNFLIGAGASSQFFGNLGEIENVLTELTDKEIDKEEKDLIRASVQGYFFREVLLPNLKLLAIDASSNGVRSSYEEFLRTIYRILVNRRSTLLGKQVNLFTTNVDMLFEFALESLEIDANDGFCGKIQPRLDLSEFSSLKFRHGIRYGYRSEVPTVNLLKLHGSAAWLQKAEQIYFDHDLSQIKEIEELYESAKGALLDIPDAGVIDLDQMIQDAAQRKLDGNGKAFAAKYQTLSIVNPEKTKFSSTVLNETYYELIRRFANEMERENTVLFVHGFSFRDEHLRDLVLRAAKTNPTLQVIIFCYSIDGKVEMEKRLPSKCVKNGNILFVTPLEPAEGMDVESLSLDVVRKLLFDPINEGLPTKPDLSVELTVRTDDDGESDDA